MSGGRGGAPTAGGSSGAGGAGRSGVGGVASGGANNGGGGSLGNGGSAGKGGSASGGQGGGSSSAMCKQIATSYATELEKQIVCSAGAACADKQVAAPGCSCRVFIQPKDPFAIEALSNIENEWFVNDCQNPVCPTTCTTASKGTCQNGRCF